MDFVRFLHGPLLGLIGFVLIVCALAYITKKTAVTNENIELVGTINKIRNWLLVLGLACFAWFAFSAATVNETSRKVIDRSVVNDRADTLRNDSREAVEKSNKERGK